MNGLAFDALRSANLDRCETAFHPLDEWTPTDWFTATAGELGEAGNVIKKGLRTKYAHLDVIFAQSEGRSQRQQIADELADTVIYIDLLCARLRIDLGEAVIRKFNVVSERVHSEVRL